MKKYDPRLPSSLKELQHWFGSIISRGIDINSRIQPLAPSGLSIEEEATHFILPGPKLKSHERLQIYNQQYWWRLLNILHKDFDFLLRLFGYVRFNEEIATPYLERFPSDHWSLERLGERLPYWIETYFFDEISSYAHAAAQLDYAFVHAFSAGQHNSITLDILKTEESIDLFLNQKLSLQPHITLLRSDFDLLSFRDAVLEIEDVNHFLGRNLPKIKESSCFLIVYRSNDFSLTLEELGPTEWKLLEQVSKGKTITEATEGLEDTQLSELQHWFSKWLINGFFYTG